MKNILLILLLLPVLFVAQSPTMADVHYSKEAFIENKGQFNNRDWNQNEEIEFGVNQNPFYVFFTKKGLTYRLDKIVKNPNRDKSQPVSISPKRTNISELIQVTWVGANPNVEIVASQVKPNYYSYGVKDFATREVSNLNNLKGYEKIVYKNLYPNIDVEYVFHPQGGLKYSIILHPGANAADIKMKYTSNHTSVGGEHISTQLQANGQLKIATSLGEIVEHKPFTFYNDTEDEISSNYVFNNDLLTFNLGSYDNTQKVIIDPWVVSPTFNSSTAVWEVENDAAGNVYTIGGETPMELRQYTAGGVLNWTYVTPWDTANVWLGTLATDNAGNSYITSGTSPEIERINNAGAMQWHANGNFDEYWSITFNCDKTELITGGSTMASLLGNPSGNIFNISIIDGSVLADIGVGSGSSAGGFTPNEVRSISASSTAKYYYLTHNSVGQVPENLSSCITGFDVSSGYVMDYKCEDYLPQTQNGGGLKALITGANYFYTHRGDQIDKRSLVDGSIITSVAIPGGVNSTSVFGGLTVGNSGLAVDDCNNVYVGSNDRVVKYDEDLNLLTSAMTTFSVYDVSVNANGEVLAVGAQSNNAATNRNGRIESLALSACAQYVAICCDADYCHSDTLCSNDPPETFLPSVSGGTWSGTGISAAGVFDPSVAGAGTHTITHTTSCGAQAYDIVVTTCVTLSVCIEANGDYTVTGGTGPYTWEEETTTLDCSACPFGNCAPPICNGVNVTSWNNFGTGSTVTPTGNFPIRVTDLNGGLLVITSAGSLSPCSTSPTASYTLSPSATICVGDCIDFTSTSTNVPAGAAVGWNFPGATPANSTTPSPTNICYNTAGSYWATIAIVDIATNTVLDSTGVAITVTACTVPDANFTIAPAGPYCENDCITFTSTSTYAAGATFAWDFGNTQTSTLENPAAPVCYTTAGTYTITLTVTDANGTDTETQNITITACTSPNVSFTVSPSATLCIGDCVDFTGTQSNAPAGAATGYNIDDGSGTALTPFGDNATNICYNTAGTFWVTFLMVDPISSAVYDSTGMAITVAACTGPNASINISPAGPFCENDCITFSSSSTYAAGATFAWDFGNGQNSTDENPAGSICYATAGSYTVTLTVTDANGSNTDTQIITVAACTSPSVSFTVSPSATICVGDCIDFTGTQANAPAGSATGYNIDNGTGTALNPIGDNATNICYNTAGTYWVTFLMVDPISSAVYDSTGMAITVTSCIQPDANINISPAGPYCETDCITYTSTSVYVSPATFAWDFGNGNTSNVENPIAPECYALAGTYTISFTVTDGTGTNTETQMITVVACSPPTSGFTVADSVICEDDCITVTNTSVGATSYQWTITGGSPSTSNLPDPGPICFNDEGTFSITLNAMNLYGSDSDSISIVVHPNPDVFAVGDTSVISSQTVPLEVLDPDPDYEYIWTPSTGVECDYCTYTLVMPEDTTYYVVTATNIYDCIASDSVLIEVEIVEAIGVPSAFSPNGDEINDVLKVQGFGIVNMHFVIFNQYGQKVFETIDQSQGWDGTFKGEVLNPGVFTYYVTYDNSTSKDQILKGNVTLVK